MSITTDQKPITITTKLFIAIIVSTATTVATVVASYYQQRAELDDTTKLMYSKLYDEIKNMDTQNQIQELKFENLKLEVERNRLSLERMREEIKGGRL